MAYISSNLVSMLEEVGPYGRSEFVYETTDTLPTIEAADYISNAASVVGGVAVGGSKGLKKGDLVHVRQWSALPTANADYFGIGTAAPTITALGRFVVMGISVAGKANLATLEWIDVVDDS